MMDKERFGFPICAHGQAPSLLAHNGAFQCVQKSKEILTNKVSPPNSENPKTDMLLHPLQTHCYASLVLSHLFDLRRFFDFF